MKEAELIEIIIDLYSQLRALDKNIMAIKTGSGPIYKINTTTLLEKYLNKTYDN